MVVRMEEELTFLRDVVVLDLGDEATALAGAVPRRARGDGRPRRGRAWRRAATPRRPLARRAQRRQAQRRHRHDERRGVGRASPPRCPASTSSSVRSSRTRPRRASSIGCARGDPRIGFVDVVFRRDAAPGAGDRPDARRGRRVHRAERRLRGSAEPGRRRPRVQADRAGRGRGGDGARHGAPADRAGRAHRRVGPGGRRDDDVADVERQPLPLARHRAVPPRPDRRRLDGAQRDGQWTSFTIHPPH